MNMFLILLKLITIVFIDGTLGKAFDSQRSNKDIFPKRFKRNATCEGNAIEQSSNFYTNPLKSETTNRSTVGRISVSVPNDVPAFMQLSVPNDIPAITASSF